MILDDVVVVYLDQNALSELALNRNRCPEKHRLRALLQRGHSDGSIICPVPRETIMEITGISSQQDRMLIYQLQHELANLGGQIAAFKDLHTMINEESLAIAKGLPIPSCFNLIAWHSVDDDKLAKETWRKIELGKQSMEARFSKRRSAENFGAVNLQQAEKGVLLEHVSHVFRQVERLEKQMLPHQNDHMGYDLACYLMEQQVDQFELARLKKALIERRWEKIPVIRYRTLLAAALQVDYLSPKPRKFAANDEIDIPRMAVAMNSSDVCITEAGMVALCERVNRVISKSRCPHDWKPKAFFAIGDPSKAADFIERAMAGA